MYITSIYFYIQLITDTYLYIPFLFRVSWHSCPPVQPSDALEDNVPDVHDEADFDVPDTQAVLERFMSNMSKLTDDEYRSLSVLLNSLPDPSSFSMPSP